MFLVDLLFKNKPILIILILITLGGCYTSGYIMGSNYSSYKITAKNLEEKNKSLQKVIDIQNQLTADADAKSNKLQIELEQEGDINAQLHKQIENEKSYINKHSHINANFMCFIQKSEHRNKILPSNESFTSQSVSANATIPPDRILHYITDLHSWSNNCKNKYNTLVSFYNSQQKIINSYNN